MSSRPPATGSADETLIAEGGEFNPLADSGVTGSDPDASEARPRPSRPRPSASASIARGSTIGRYVVLDLLGQGGMGVVYAAYDPELDRRVALKLLRPRGKDPELAAARLLREAQAMAKLTHPNVVTVHDVGEHEGKVFVAMEFVEGETLRDWMDRGGHDPAAVVDLFHKAGQGLASAHRAGLIHRDFKPENVLLGNDGRVQVADFGLARTTDDASVKTGSDGRIPEDIAKSLEDVFASGTRSGVSIASRVTQTGAFLGTPAYMSPEQFRSAPLGPLSDQFSFAVAMWEALYEERPFRGNSPRTLAFQVLQGNRNEAPKASNVPRRVRLALERALAIDEGERYPSMDQLLRALEPPKRSPWIPAALVAGLALATVAWIQTRPAPPSPDLCAGGEAALSQVWTQQRRDALHAGLSKVPKTWAKDVADRSVAQIDKWGDGFVLAHRDACEATQVRHTQSEQMLDLRMLCLDRRLRRLEAITDTLSDADEKTLKRAESVLRELDDLDKCADPETLVQREPLPTDADRRKAILDLQSDIERMSTLRTVGRFEPAVELAKRRASAAKATNYSPVIAELEFEWGRALSETGAEQDAHTHLFESFRVGLACGEDAIAARAAAALVSTSEELERQEGGDRWFEIAEALCQRHGGSPAIRAALFTNRGNSLRARGDHQGALDAHSQAYTLYVQGGGPRSMRAADAIYNRSTVNWVMGRYEQAGKDVSEALSIWREHVGDDHPRVIQGQLAQVMFVLRSGDSTRAVELQQGIIQKLIKLNGENSIQVADARLNLSAIAAGAEQFEVAWNASQLAMRHYESHDKADSIGYAQLLGNAANVARSLGRLDEAESLARRARDLIAAKSGDEHADVATALVILALTLEDQGRLDEAIIEAERGYDILKNAKGPEYAGLIELDIYLARFHRRQGARKAARAQLELGAKLIQSAEVSQLDVGEFWSESAMFEAALGQPAAAIQAQTKARKAYAQAGDSGRRALAKAEAAWSKMAPASP